ncbi:hypothetical protein LI142_10910 [Eubacterium limosum]|uniref:hypothetical protein n=1 Tax=Eubacterium limosum TaxID=1736 RepID=UPI001D0787D7|nr:hypothetical protein [Eubacterium limosum]MCB6570009.1 hypothetical protein [Eubacterium limosum]
MCDCIKEWQKDIKTACEVDEVIFPVEILSGRLFIPVKTQKKGKCKEERLLLAKCPFCGQPYEGGPDGPDC